MTKLFYRLFYFLEAHGILEHTNPLHLYALKYVFLPRINHSIDLFVEGWNNYGIRTEHHHSPKQLFTQGVLRLQRSGLVSLDFMENVDTSYGVDNNRPSSTQEDPEGVRIPENHYNSEL